MLYAHLNIVRHYICQHLTTRREGLAEADLGGALFYGAKYMVNAGPPFSESWICICFV